MRDGEPKRPVEHHPSAATAVEAEQELTQIAGQVRGVYRALVRAKHAPLVQRGDPVHRAHSRPRRQAIAATQGSQSSP